MIRVGDALGREIALSRPPTRIVSLVPSETESVARLAGVERIVGRTSYCHGVDAVPVVGGTKSIDVDAVLALAPDLVLANKEENGKRDIERLIAAGVCVHVSFPCSVAESLAYVRALAALLGVVDAKRAWLSTLEPPATPVEGGRRVFVPIWRDPWMTFDGRTYASDLLAHAGALNVFADRARLFPLAADLGQRTPIDPGARDTRYPRTRMEEVAERRPELVLLPDEPYEFDAEHAAEVETWDLGARIELVSGQDLFWYGVRTLEALDRLRALIR